MKSRKQKKGRRKLKKILSKSKKKVRKIHRKSQILKKPLINAMK